jgi:hypothetical protein
MQACLNLRSVTKLAEIEGGGLTAPWQQSGYDPGSSDITPVSNIKFNDDSGTRSLNAGFLDA